MSSLQSQGSKICRFAQAGNCRYGTSCKFSHNINGEDSTKIAAPNNDNAKSGKNTTRNILKQRQLPQSSAATGGKGKSRACEIFAPLTVPQPVEPQTLDKILGGSLSVKFGAGLEVISISPITISSSTVTIDSLPRRTTNNDILMLSTKFKPSLTLQAIKTHPRGDGTIRALVQFDDNVAADVAVKALHDSMFKGRKITVQAIRPANVSQDDTKIECTWFMPANTAMLQMRDSHIKTAIVRTVADGVFIRGKRIKALPQPDRHNFRLPYSVLLVNLDPYTTEADIREEFSIVSDSIPEVKLREPKFKLSENETLALIRRRFRVVQDDDLTLIPGYGRNEARQRAIISFANADEAAAISVEIKQELESDTIFKEISFEFTLTYSASFNIPGNIYRVIKDEIRSLQRNEHVKVKKRQGTYSRKGKERATEAGIRNDTPARIKIIDSRGPGAVVHINGEGRPAVVRVKGAIQKLLSGKIICDDEGKPIWHAALHCVDGQRLIQQVCSLGVYVQCDARNQRVTLYGASAACEIAEETLKERYKLLLTMQHEIVLDGRSRRMGMRGGFQAVKELLGEDMAFLNPSGTKLIVKCSPADISQVRALLLQPPGKLAGKQGPQNKGPTTNEDICPVCTDPADAPAVRTSCGHSYCKLCIQGYVKSVLDGRKFPIRCFYTSEDTNTQCMTPLSITLIQSLLSHADVERLFEASFSSYVQALPNEYSY